MQRNTRILPKLASWSGACKEEIYGKPTLAQDKSVAAIRRSTACSALSPMGRKSSSWARRVQGWFSLPHCSGHQGRPGRPNPGPICVHSDSQVAAFPEGCFPGCMVHLSLRELSCLYMVRIKHTAPANTFCSLPVNVISFFTMPSKSSSVVFLFQQLITLWAPAARWTKTLLALLLVLVLVWSNFSGETQNSQLKLWPLKSFWFTS